MVNTPKIVEKNTWNWEIYIAILKQLTNKKDNSSTFEKSYHTQNNHPSLHDTRPDGYYLSLEKVGRY